MKFIRNLFLIATSLYLVGCGSLPEGATIADVPMFAPTKRYLRTEDIMQSWVGSDIDSVIAKWGSPSGTHRNKDGSTLVEWGTVSTSTTTYTNGLGQRVGQDSNSTSCVKAFLINSKGTIQKWGLIPHNDRCVLLDMDIKKALPLSTPIPKPTL